MIIRVRAIKPTDDLDDSFSEAELEQGHIAWCDEMSPGNMVTGSSDHDAIGALMVALSCTVDFPIVIDDIILEDLE